MLGAVPHLRLPCTLESRENRVRNCNLLVADVTKIWLLITRLLILDVDRHYILYLGEMNGKCSLSQGIHQHSKQTIKKVTIHFPLKINKCNADCNVLGIWNYRWLVYSRVHKKLVGMSPSNWNKNDFLSPSAKVSIVTCFTMFINSHFRNTFPLMYTATSRLQTVSLLQARMSPCFALIGWFLTGMIRAFWRSIPSQS